MQCCTKAGTGGEVAGHSASRAQGRADAGMEEELALPGTLYLGGQASAAPTLSLTALPPPNRQVVPGGVVVFFPSFSYADQVHAR